MPEFPGRLRTPRLTAAPATPSAGELYQNTTTNQLMVYNGTAWVALTAGAELAYVEITAPVSATVVAEASAVTVVSSGAITYAAVPILIEFSAPTVAAATCTVNLNLWDAATNLGTIATFARTDGTINVACRAARRLTPTAASHTYMIKAWAVTNAGTVQAGAGGVGQYLPGFIRITYV